MTNSPHTNANAEADLLTAILASGSDVPPDPCADHDNERDVIDALMDEDVGIDDRLTDEADEADSMGENPDHDGWNDFCLDALADDDLGGEG